jgi:hypothetical protein
MVRGLSVAFGHHKAKTIEAHNNNQQRLIFRAPEWLVFPFPCKSMVKLEAKNVIFLLE